MRGYYLQIFLVLMGVMTAHRSFVDPAALPQSEQDKLHPSGSADAKDTEVQELESLKHPTESEGKSIEIVKSQSTSIINENGKQNERHDLREFIDENGKLVAKVHQHSESSSAPGQEPHERVTTELEVPSEGVHHTVVQDSNNEGQKELAKAFPGAARLMQSTGEALGQPLALALPIEITGNGNRRSFNADITKEENNNMDHYSSYTGVQYSPLDMAEYIFWTGDEKGVTLAIEEFLQDGLMTREDAIQFLQEIKYNIDYLQTHYAQQRLKTIAEESFKDKQQNYDFNPPMRSFNHENILKTIANGVYERNNNIAPGFSLPLDFEDPRQEMYKRNVQENLLNNAYKMSNEQYEKNPAPIISEEDYDELLEKLRVADFLYTEYSLEEIIYQLAKVMFTQSLSRGSTEAQMALQKFTNYMETEAEQGRISKGLEKKVLDVLIEALTDTLTEHPELVTIARAGLGGNALSPKNKILRELLEMSAPNSNAGMISSYAAKNHNSPNKFNHLPMWMQNKEKSIGEHQSSPIQMQPLKRFKMSV